jgi:hypothetical protein
MDIKYKILVSELIIFLVSLFIVMKFKLFNSYMFFMIMTYMVVIMIFVAFSFYQGKVLLEIDNYRVQTKQSFPYAWSKVNSMLRQMPGSEGLSWDSGIGITSSTQEQKNNDGKLETFRYFLGYTNVDRKFILIIYNCTKEDIIYYKPDPSSDEIENPWLNHDPYKNKSSENMMFNPYNRYDRRYKRPPQQSLSSEFDFSDSIDKANNVL